MVFDRSQAGRFESTQFVPCNYCKGCRSEYARQWAVRAVHEAQMSSCTCFITLTYSDKWLPKILGEPTLFKEDIVKFRKDYRKKYGNGIKLKFFGCGEYGDKLSRPHYHLIVYNHNFDFDKTFHKYSAKGFPLYISSSLDKLWSKGHTYVGDMSFATAKYCAMYMLKKAKGDLAVPYYSVLDESTGELVSRESEYCIYPTRPGLGTTWIEKYWFDLYKDDFLVIDGVKHKAPRFYDRWMEKFQPDYFKEVKHRRYLSSLENKVEDFNNFMDGGRSRQEGLYVKERIWDLSDKNGKHSLRNLE
jgi:hypothetical protein